MKYFNLLLVCVAFIGCDSPSQHQAKMRAKAEAEMDQLLYEMEKAEEKAEEETVEAWEPTSYFTEFDKPEDMPNACIPIMSDLWESENRSVYDYLKDHLDTLGPQVPEYYDDKNQCGFSQQFSNEIYYTESSCSEIGWDMQLTTMCPSKDVLYYLLNGLYNGGDYVWNADSTKYGTADGGAGCYYRLVQDQGYWGISVYCGC
mgnify:CR=1 FL=1